jgi:hypothetical protein
MSDEIDEIELLSLISKQLDKMSNELKNISERIDSLEGKTDDLHHYVPFVGWLEEVGQNVSNRFRWLRGYRAPPVLLTHNVTLEEESSKEKVSIISN